MSFHQVEPDDARKARRNGNEEGLEETLTGQISEGIITTSSINEETGLPNDNGYLECGLPEFLQNSIRAMVDAWNKLDSGLEYLHWDCDYCNLQSDINNAEVNQLISTEQAWFLREKYLRMERV